MVAPSASMSSARCNALSSVLKRPPSEKESGVTLRMPMIMGREIEPEAPALKQLHEEFCQINAKQGDSLRCHPVETGG
jgi:hypothetical protein